MLKYTLLVGLVACREEAWKNEGEKTDGSVVDVSDDSGNADDSSSTDDSRPTDDSGPADDTGPDSPADDSGPDSPPDSRPDSGDSGNDCQNQPPYFDWGVVALQDAQLSGKIGGRVLIGGTGTIHDFDLGADDPGTQTLVGDRLDLAGGLVWGDVVYGSSYAADTEVGIQGTVSQGSPVDMVAMEANIRALSSQLAGLSDNGVVQVQSWMEIDLTGTSSENVFTVQATDLSVAVKMVVDVPAGSSVVVNVEGDPVRLADFAVTMGNADTEHFFMNFPDATAITVERFAFYGTLLAPDASLNLADARLQGQVVVQDLTGDGSILLGRYSGNLPCP